MRILCSILVLSMMAFPAEKQDQAYMLGRASAQINDALNIYAKTAGSISSKMTAQQTNSTLLLFAAAMAIQDNSLSLQAVCLLQQQSKSPEETKQSIVLPLCEQFRTSNSQQISSLSVAISGLPNELIKEANLVMVAVSNAAAIIEKGCQ